MKRAFSVLVALVLASCGGVVSPPSPGGEERLRDVCPPFHLRDGNGEVINPVTGENTDKPYSPRRTCGACHDYEKIVEGFHFQQGRGEEPAPWLKERYAWVTSPGDYGGRW